MIRISKSTPAAEGGHRSRREILGKDGVGLQKRNAGIAAFLWRGGWIRVGTSAEEPDQRWWMPKAGSTNTRPNSF
jgi:hypothetical protein